MAKIGFLTLLSLQNDILTFLGLCGNFSKFCAEIIKVQGANNQMYLKAHAVENFFLGFLDTPAFQWSVIEHSPGF